MSEEEISNKLSAYLGFAKKKKSIYVGMKLEEMLSLSKIALLVILPECSTKNEEKLLRIAPTDKLFQSIRYQGSFDVKACLGFDKLKAFGVKDVSLAKAIYETMKRENDKEAKNEQI